MKIKKHYSFEDLRDNRVHAIKAQSEWEARKNLAKIVNLTPEMFEEFFSLCAVEIE